MKARTWLATVVALAFASQASASVISASSQTARSKSADRVDYLDVTTVQNELNASMRAATDVSAPTALGAKSVPSTTSGGFLLTAEPTASSRFKGVGGNVTESLFNPESEKSADAISRDYNGGPGAVIANGSSGGRWGGGNRGKGPGDRDRDRRWGGGDRRRGGGGGGGGGVHATPEPSTWLLLGAGLTLVGVVEVIRRRS